MDAPGYHGGNLNAARHLFPAAPEPWIDLSTGINPIPYPIGEIPSELWARLPQPGDLAGLETAARAAYGAGPEATIVAAPGTQAIIQWLPQIFTARRVGILGHTYGAHAECWRASGAQIVTAQSLAEFEKCDVGVVVNPNNPDGRLVEPAQLAQTAASMARRSGLLIVDEAFMDVTEPAMSLVPALPAAAAVVLRSFGKTYGLAGLRLGFAVTSEGFGSRLRTVLGPWAVSGPAIAVGRQALDDSQWLRAATARLGQDSRRLDHLLKQAGFTVVGGTPLFRLAECDGAMWFRKLGRAGILTRPFPAAPGVLRFGLPSAESGWARLKAALTPIPALF